jgi:membrane peptidoglycan carboxypeptidase
VTPFSVTAGYATLANHGIKVPTRTILAARAGGQASSDEIGPLVYSAPEKPKGARVIPAPVADTVVDVLHDVVRHGTATSVHESVPQGSRDAFFGKTGTGQDFTNAWFVGCKDNDVCVGVWMGYDREYVNGRPHSMRGVEGVDKVFGGTLPAKIFARVWTRYDEILTAKATAEDAPTPAPTPRRRRRHTLPPVPAASTLPPSTPVPTLTPTPSRTSSPKPTKTVAPPPPSPTRTLPTLKPPPTTKPPP